VRASASPIRDPSTKFVAEGHALSRDQRDSRMVRERSRLTAALLVLGSRICVRFAH